MQTVGKIYFTLSCENLFSCHDIEAPLEVSDISSLHRQALLCVEQEIRKRNQGVARRHCLSSIDAISYKIGERWFNGVEWSREQGPEPFWTSSRFPLV